VWEEEALQRAGRRRRAEAPAPELTVGDIKLAAV